MDKEKELTIKEMKKIAHEILEEETKKSNIKINMFPITFIEYYNSYVFKEKCKLTTLADYLTLPLRAGGFNDLKGNIIIFIEYINKRKRLESKLFRLAEICYHEARHSIQQEFDIYSYDGFLYGLDEYIQSESTIDYKLEHDKYSFEIGANIYAITKAKDYLLKKYPNLYEKHQDEIDKLEKRYYYDYITYDAVDTIERFIEITKWKMQIHNANKIEGLEKVSPILEIFLNDDLTFKKITEIIENQIFKTLDKRIIYAFLSSKSFLESIKIEELSNEELNLITEALKYTNTIYQNQQTKIEEYKKQKVITIKEYLSTQKSILKKLIFLEKNLSKEIKQELKQSINITRNENRRQEHIKEIPNYLEKANNLVRKRSKGYITLSIFYTIGLFISIITIIYIITK